MPSSRRAPFILLVSAVSLAGCGKSFGELELEAGKPVATVPFEVRYARNVVPACVALKGSCGYAEPLKLVTAICEAPGPGACSVDTAQDDRLLVTAKQAGAYRLRVVAQGLESGDEVEAELMVNVQPSADVQLSAAYGGPNETFYDAAGVGGQIRVTAKLVDPSAKETRLAYRDQDFVWAAEDVGPDASRGAIRNVQAGAAPGVDVAVSIGELRGAARYDVLTPRGNERVRVFFDSQLDPERIVLRHNVVGYVVYAALETSEGRRFPGGTEQLHVLGDGCVLQQRAVDFDLVPVEAVREIDAQPGASCTLLVGDGQEQRVIPFTRETAPD